ncbi:MAG: ABC transporter permease [Propionibacteriaceae bacterium]
MMRDRITRLLAPLLLAAVLIGVWGLTVEILHPPEFLAPSPKAVWTALRTELTSPVFWPFFWQTVAEAIGGSVLGIVTGIPLGILIHRWPWFNTATAPFLGASQAVPAIALAPLLVLWVGYGTWAVVILCALMVFFPIIVATALGLSLTPAAIRDAARMDGASRWQIVFYLEIPEAVPAILTGIRNGVALSVTGAIVGEMVMGGSGLGTLLTVQRDAANTPAMVATIVILAALAATLFLLIRSLERTTP